MSHAPSQKPLIAIVGATGTGKSRLAVALAERFNGEIINGDALQMYHGLPITTNKIPLGETRGIPHHLLGCIKQNEQPWTVQQYQNRASVIIEEIWSRKKLPILVGGTHYYTQSLLFRDTVVVQENLEHIDHEEQEQRWPILDASTEEMLEELRRVDPAIAQRWHPNDRRKIRRSLEIWFTTGRKASQIYEQQRQVNIPMDSEDIQSDWDATGSTNSVYQSSDMASHSTLRYDTLIFWTHAYSDILNSRLEERVNNMISEGLLSEVESMYSFLQHQEQQGCAVDQSRGIWVAIGFKELLPFFMDGNNSESLRKEGIERTKIATRQYAKRQVRWIRLKLQRAIATANSSHKLFLFDTTDLSQWLQDVEGKAKYVTEAFLNSSALPKPESLSKAAKEMLVLTEGTPRAARYCDNCGKTLMAEGEWLSHINSKGHKSAVRPKVNWRALYPKCHHKQDVVNH